MLKKVNNKGFSIIEVLIVLAIAGLIMLVVFLAVPALRLNAANGARQNDASRVSSAITDCLSNRNGVLLSCDTFKDPDVAATSTYEVELGQLSQLQIGNTTNAATALAAAQPAATAHGACNTAANSAENWCVLSVSSTAATANTQVAAAQTWVTTNNPNATKWLVAYNAKCNADGSTFGYSSNRRDFAVLYGKGVRSGTSIPVCIGS